jgi:KDO2-lipid IV(A) lauroyltransferase
MAMRLVGDALGRPLRYVARPHNHACLQAWIEASRQRVFGPTLAKKKLREPLADTLRAGEPVCWLGDQDFSHGHAFVPFFGVPAATVTALPELARAGDAAVLAFAHERRSDGGYTLRLAPAFADFPSEDAVADTARVMAALEALIRRCPEQYLWLHQRFKRQPDGLKRNY